MPYNSDRDAAAARTLKRALVLIWTVGLNAREPHVRSALCAPRVEDTFGSNSNRSIKHGATLAEMLSQSLDASAIRYADSDKIVVLFASDDAMSEAAVSVRLYGLMDRHAGKAIPQILASPFVRDL